jgi:hypothetical protein
LLITATLFLDRPEITDPLFVVGGVHHKFPAQSTNFINFYKTEVDLEFKIEIDYSATYTAACPGCTLNNSTYV